MDQLQRAHNAMKQDEQVSDKRFLETSKRRLLGVVEKKLQTAFIGALSKFENSRFGHLFGFGKDDSECTDQELQWRDIWDEVRNEILTNGNRQCRALQSEINEYEIKWRRHELNLPVVPRNVKRG